MKIISTIKINIKLKENIIKLLYKLINNLLYFDNIKREMRLYISIKTLKQKVFKLTHNKIRYLDYIYIYKKLTYNVYIFNIFIKLYKYLRYYSYYQLYQIPKYKFYKSLQSIYDYNRFYFNLIKDFLRL